jgi:hypothetical protein
MRLSLVRDDRLEFRSPPRAGALSIIGLGLAVIGSSAWFAPGPMTPERTLTAIGLIMTGAVFAVVTRQRSRRVVIDLDRRELEADGRWPLGDGPRIRLGGAAGDAGRLEPRFWAEVVLAGGSWRVLEDPDPAAVLMGVRAVHRAWSELDIEPGWGLANWAPRTNGSLPHGPRRRAAPEAFSFSQREAGWTVVVGGLVIGFLLLRSIAARLAVDTPAPAVSLWVPAVVILAMLFTGALVLTARTTLRFNGVIVWERSLLGIALERVRIGPEAVCGVHAVGPVPGQTTHVLVDAGERVLALPCAAGEADARASEIAHRVSAARDPGDPVH